MGACVRTLDGAHESSSKYKPEASNSNNFSYSNYNITGASENISIEPKTLQHTPIACHNKFKKIAKNDYRD